MQVNLSTAGKAFQTVDSNLFYVQLDLSSNDTNFNNTHPRLQVKFVLAGVEIWLCMNVKACLGRWQSTAASAFAAKVHCIMLNPVD